MQSLLFQIEKLSFVDHSGEDPNNLKKHDDDKEGDDDDETNYDDAFNAMLAR